jgi:hypothetical protein
MEHREGDESRDEGGLGEEGDERGSAVAGAKKWGAFD